MHINNTHIYILKKKVQYSTSIMHINTHIFQIIEPHTPIYFSTNGLAFLQITSYDTDWVTVKIKVEE